MDVLRDRLQRSLLPTTDYIISLFLRRYLDRWSLCAYSLGGEGERGWERRQAGYKLTTTLCTRTKKMLWDRQASYMPANYYTSELLDQCKFSFSQQPALWLALLLHEDIDGPPTIIINVAMPIQVVISRLGRLKFTSDVRMLTRRTKHELITTLIAQE
jgi:hypothetical protein